MTLRHFIPALFGGIAALTLAGCGGGGGSGSGSQTTIPDGSTSTPGGTVGSSSVTGVNSTVMASFAAPWTLAFMPDGQMLVTERPASASTQDDTTAPGALWLVTATGSNSTAITGVPANVGVLDVKLAPDFATSRSVYVSYMERDPTAPRVGRNAADRGAQPVGLAVMRGTLAVGALQLTNVTTIWRQAPKIVSNIGSGEPGGRMAFSPDAQYLFIASGDRQELDATFLFRLDNNLGKIVRIKPDGSIPSDNPYVATAGALPEIWTLGHRNQYGLVFNAAGDLWEAEMGPEGGDELNLIQPKSNYGWPAVSYGNHYGGGSIPKPAAGDGYAASAYWWTPVIAPSEMIFYSGTLFPDWKGDAILSGLASEALIRARITGTTAQEVQRISMGNRIRCVREAPDGSLWILEDQPSGRLIRLTPIVSATN